MFVCSSFSQSKTNWIILLKLPNNKFRSFSFTFFFFWGCFTLNVYVLVALFLALTFYRSQKTVFFTHLSVFLFILYILTKFKQSFVLIILFSSFFCFFNHFFSFFLDFFIFFCSFFSIFSFRLFFCFFLLLDFLSLLQKWLWKLLFSLFALTLFRFCVGRPRNSAQCGD